MNEHELSTGLRAAAASVDVRADLAEVELGAGRLRQRRRVATGIVAAMLIAGAGGVGFGLGRSIADDDGGIAAADEPDASDAPDAGGAPADTVAPLPVDDVPAATLAPTQPEIADAEAPASGAFDATAGVAPPIPMETVYERTLDDGVRLRVQRGETYDPDEGWWESDWRPAAFCFPSADARITLDGPDLVDVQYIGWYDEPYRGLQMQALEAGHADGRPLRLLIVQVDPLVTEVAVAWDDGAADRAPTSNGAAVLAVDGTNAWATPYVVELQDADGVRTVASTDLDVYADADWRAACSEPPPALPDPGEQPADPAAARAAVEARFALLWDTDVPREDKLDVLDDWTGVAEAVDAVAAGGYAEVARTAVHTIEELVFTSPTTAWFRYSLLTDVSDFYDRYGTASLVDGVWQFPRDLMCQDLGLAGAVCEPGYQDIYPPSWYERYGDPIVDRPAATPAPLGD